MPPGVAAATEVARLLDTTHAQTENPSISVFKRASLARRAALLETLYASGMWVSEAVSLPAHAASAKGSHL
jgi:integrase/recombinase XerD